MGKRPYADDMASHSSSREPAIRDPESSVEVYDSGRKVRLYKVDTSEWEADPPEKRITIREIEPCSKHNASGHSSPQSDSHLVSVFGQHEGYLNE